LGRILLSTKKYQTIYKTISSATIFDLIASDLNKKATSKLNGGLINKILNNKTLRNTTLVSLSTNRLSRINGDIYALANAETLENLLLNLSGIRKISKNIRLNRQMDF
jgi:hypothetical protein